MMPEATRNTMLIESEKPTLNGWASTSASRLTNEVSLSQRRCRRLPAAERLHLVGVGRSGLLELRRAGGRGEGAADLVGSS